MRPFPVLALALLPGAALAEVPKVVTDLPPVQSLVAQVMGDLGAPEILLEQGGNAHSYQLKPSQARALQQADLVVWVGPQMTPWLDRAISGVALKGTALTLLEVPGTYHQDFAAGHGAHDHGAEADPDGDAHEGLDPHAWLDPGNAETWLGAIAQALSAADPEHAATYAANAEAAQARLATLDAGLQAELAPVAARPFVVFHAAYGYFAHHYGLQVAGAVAMGDATDPGAAHLAELRADLTADHVVCAFPEAQHDPRQVDILLEGTGVKRGGALDPSGSALPYGPDNYAALMQGLADTLSACLTP